jgi:hypothetical protein
LVDQLSGIVFQRRESRQNSQRREIVDELLSDCLNCLAYLFDTLLSRLSFSVTMNKQKITGIQIEAPTDSLR